MASQTFKYAGYDIDTNWTKSASRNVQGKAYDIYFNTKDPTQNFAIEASSLVNLDEFLTQNNQGFLKADDPGFFTPGGGATSLLKNYDPDNAWATEKYGVQYGIKPIAITPEPELPGQKSGYSGTPGYKPQIAGQAESKMVNGQRVDINTGQPYSPTRSPGESIEDFTKRIDTSLYLKPGETFEQYEARASATQGVKNPLLNTQSSSPIDPNLQLQPGETVEQYYARLPGSKPGSVVTGQPRTDTALSPALGAGTTQANPSSVVATSTALRMKEKAEALKEALGLGDSPVLPDIFGSTDQASLNLARQERDAINKELETILAERLAIDAEFRKFESNAGEGVTETGRRGIVSEEGRKIQEQYDALNRRELVLETKLGNRNAVIKELMSSQQQEYAMAVDEYNTRFSQAMQLYQIFDKEEDELKSNAKANLEVLSGSIQAQIEAGKVDPSQISSVQRSQLQDLETQAGLPLGSTLAVLQTLKPGEEKLYAGVDDFGGFSYITKDANGNIKVYKSANAVPQVPPKTPKSPKSPDSGNNQAKNNKVLSTAGLPLTTATADGGMTQSALNKVVQALSKVVASGQDPVDVALGIWQNIINGTPLEEIRTGMVQQLGWDTANKYLDAFMQALQGTASNREP